MTSAPEPRRPPEPLPDSVAVPVVTVHLWGVPTIGIGGALLRMATGRQAVRRASGLRFVKLVGTGTDSFRLRNADLRHWGVIAAWDDEADARVFETSSLVDAWDHAAVEKARFRLRPVSSRGTWAGRSPFEPVSRSRPGGRVAAITRARIRPGRWREFARSSPPVSAAAAQAPGLKLATGIGEAPIGLQGTFTVWQDNESLLRFVRGQAHAKVVGDTKRANWFAEELFARFEVVAARGVFRGQPVEARSGNDLADPTA